eukprot:3336413-Pyramimonas_sp.AAC.1
MRNMDAQSEGYGERERETERELDKVVGQNVKRLPHIRHLAVGDPGWTELNRFDHVLGRLFSWRGGEKVERQGGQDEAGGRGGGARGGG